MRTGKNGFRRITAMICALALCASMLPTAVFATESADVADVPETAVTQPVEDEQQEVVETPGQDETDSTPAPDTGTGSTSAPEATPVGNTDDTKEPVESPEPSEEPTDDTTESGEEGTETTDSTTVPSEENVENTESSDEPKEQVQPVQQTLKAADAVPSNVEEKAADHVGLGEIYADAENRIFLTLSDGDEVSAPLQTGTFIIQLDGEELAKVTVSNLPAYSLFLNINAVEYQVNAWGDTSNIEVSENNAGNRRGYLISNLTPYRDKEYTVTVNFTAPAVKDHDAIVIQDSENFYGTFYWTKGTATADDFARPIKVYVNDVLKYDGTIQTPKDLSHLEYWFEANLEKYTSEVRIDSGDLDQYTRTNVTVYLTTKCPCGKENCQCAGSCDCIPDCKCPECVPVEGEDMIVTPYGTITYDDDAEGVKVKMSVEIYVNGELATTTKQFTTTSAVIGGLGFSANEAHGYHFFAVGEAKNSYEMALYTDEVNVEAISLQITVNGKTFYCGYDAQNSKSGKLTVRYTSSDAKTTRAVSNLDAEVAKEPNAFYAQFADAEQRFYINEQDTLKGTDRQL